MGPICSVTKLSYKLFKTLVFYVRKDSNYEQIKKNTFASQQLAQTLGNVGAKTFFEIATHCFSVSCNQFVEPRQSRDSHKMMKSEISDFVEHSGFEPLTSTLPV